jgi:hypothetical protein
MVVSSCKSDSKEEHCLCILYPASHIPGSQHTVTSLVSHAACPGTTRRWGGYWEAVPRVRTVVEAYNLTVYELVPAQVTQAFISMVRQREGWHVTVWAAVVVALPFPAMVRVRMGAW